MLQHTARLRIFVPMNLLLQKLDLPPSSVKGDRAGQTGCLRETYDSSFNNSALISIVSARVGSACRARSKCSRAKGTCFICS